MSDAAGNLTPFDPQSGSIIERLLFNNRAIIVVLCAVITAVLGFEATRLELGASFKKTIPTRHPFIVNYLSYERELGNAGNVLRIAIENRDGTIYDAAYLETLRRISDEVFLLPGVDRPFMKSLWTPDTRWLGVTEEGLDGGQVIPDDYDGSPKSLAQFRENVARSGELGQIVAADGKSSVIYAPLLGGEQGVRLDYAQLSAALEAIRDKYQNGSIGIHMVGFGKIVGDLIAGLRAMLTYFLATIAIAACVLFRYTGDVRSTAIVVTTSLIAVVWQLGLLRMLGYSLDPYSILVPFMVFAIGMSHGVQKMNGIMQDIGRRGQRLVAARLTFRRLFLAGLTALLADATGFAVLTVIDIEIIREVAISASIGVLALIFTNLILLPILLSYSGVSAKAAARSVSADRVENMDQTLLARVFNRFTHRAWATTAVGSAALAAGIGLVVGQHLTTGDLDPGAPELRQESRYNEDVRFMNAAYGATSDVFAVMLKTRDGECSKYDALMRMDALEWELNQLPGVEATSTLALLNRRSLVGLNEGNWKWYELIQNQRMLNYVTAHAPPALADNACDMTTMFVYLTDHKAETLTGVVEHVQAFSAANDTASARFLLAAGNAGIEAATNIVVEQARREMVLLVYGVVGILCLIAFRSLRAALIALLPLMLTSVLAEALMVVLGIGVKVATLPVIALGVGIGVDYAIYILSVMLAHVRAGASLSDAYNRTLHFTGKVVLLTGAMLAAGVATWTFSPIKLQADMGIMLAFMFLLNMLGALILIPALAYFLLPRNRSGRVRPATEGPPPLPA